MRNLFKCLLLTLPWLFLAACGFFSPTPVYWADQNGVKRQVAFSPGGGSDLYDAYRVCDTNWNCYQAHFTANRETYKKRRRGMIRLSEAGNIMRVYAEHRMSSWTDEILAPFCSLTLKFDDYGDITSAEYSSGNKP